MSLSRLAAIAGLALLVACLGACTREPREIHYQDSGGSQAESRPVTELQQRAITALGNAEYQQAIETLQRALRIQPRNAWSWHYLARSYGFQGDLERCRAMLERSASYAGDDAQLVRANRLLRQDCD